MPETDLLYETLDATVAADADHRWRQSVWFDTTNNQGEECGTAGCLFGWRAFLDGFDKISKSHALPGPYLIHPDGRTLAYWENSDGIQTIREYVQERLGLTDEQADALSNEENRMEDLKEIVDKIVRGEEVYCHV